jgi:hypothetical protein
LEQATTANASHCARLIVANMAHEGSSAIPPLDS